MLRLLAVACIPNIVVALGLSVARIQHSGRTVLWMQGAQCVLTLALTFVLLPRLGIEGIGIAWLASQVDGGGMAEPRHCCARSCSPDRPCQTRKADTPKDSDDNCTKLSGRSDAIRESPNGQGLWPTMPSTSVAQKQHVPSPQSAST